MTPEEQTRQSLIEKWDELPLWCGLMLMPSGLVLVAAVSPMAH